MIVNSGWQARSGFWVQGSGLEFGAFQFELYFWGVILAGSVEEYEQKRDDIPEACPVHARFGNHI